MYLGQLENKSESSCILDCQTLSVVVCMGITVLVAEFRTIALQNDK